MVAEPAARKFYLAEIILTHPVLYSFRRCPYAIRARLAIACVGIDVELREILLRDKPRSMLDISAKGTVPVLAMDDGKVLDESLDIMVWALRMQRQHPWLDGYDLPESRKLIDRNDGVFKYYLDRYKYADRYPERPREYYRLQAEFFIRSLESRLKASQFLCSDRVSLIDAAIFPFIRQFSMVDAVWFAALSYPRLQVWLKKWLNSALFKSVMKKYPVWRPGDRPVWFGGDAVAVNFE